MQIPCSLLVIDKVSNYDSSTSFPRRASDLNEAQAIALQLLSAGVALQLFLIALQHPHARTSQTGRECQLKCVSLLASCHS